MLKIDRYQDVAGVRIYGDDEHAHKFYALPSNISYRLDDNGRPAFKFVKYRFPVDRADGKKGGGYVFFDVAFEVPADKEQAIKAQLQAGVDAAHQGGTVPANLLGIIAVAPGPKGPPPTVELGSPTFTRGTCNFLLSDSTGALIQKVNGAAKPSLYGKNVAAFSLELTPEGASLFEQTMQGQGVGGVAVAYELWMWARLPPVTGRAWFNGRDTYSFIQSAHVDDFLCDDETYRNDIREKLYSAETLGVKIDAGFAIPGDPAATSKLVDSIRSSLMRALEETIARKALKPLDPVAADKRELPEGDFVTVERNMQLTRDIHWEQTYSETSVIEWNINPQSNVPNITTLKGPDGKPIVWQDYAVEADLDDPFFKQLNVSIGVNADFAALPIHSVEVHLEYKQGTTHQVGEFQFSDASKRERFSTYISDDVWLYEWFYEVNFKDSAKTFKSEPKKTDEKILTVNVDDLGILHVDIECGGDVNFDQVAAVQLSFEYDAKSGKIAEQFTLTKDARTASVKQAIFEPRERAYRWKARYFMVDGKEHDGDWVEGFADRLVVNDPFGATKTVAVRAAGDLSTEIDQIFVDLVYEDAANDFVQTTSIALSASSPFFDWKFPTIGDGKGTVSYSGQIRHRNGTVTEIPKTVATSSTILVGEVFADKLVVKVMADLLDFGALKLAKVSLRYEDLANAVSERADLVFKATDTAEKQWVVALKDPAKDEYEWQASYFLADGSKRATDRARSSELTLMLELPGVPATGPV